MRDLFESDGFRIVAVLACVLGLILTCCEPECPCVREEPYTYQCSHCAVWSKDHCIVWQTSTCSSTRCVERSTCSEDEKSIWN